MKDPMTIALLKNIPSWFVFLKEWTLWFQLHLGNSLTPLVQSNQIFKVSMTSNDPEITLENSSNLLQVVVENDN